MAETQLIIAARYYFREPLFTDNLAMFKSNF